MPTDCKTLNDLEKESYWVVRKRKKAIGSRHLEPMAKGKYTTNITMRESSCTPTFDIEPVNFFLPIIFHCGILNLL